MPLAKELEPNKTILSIHLPFFFFFFFFVWEQMKISLQGGTEKNQSD